MKRNCPAALLVSAMLTGQSAAMAASRPVELKWDELSSHIQGREIALVLPDATALTGEVEALRDDALVLNLKNTSNSKAHPKGNAVIPRAAVTLISLKASPGRWGRGLGVTLGTVAGMAAGAYVAAERARSVGAGVSVFASIAGAGAVAGYFIGNSADRRTTQIRVVP